MKSVFVTGASTGIGRATALRLDAAGWQVFAGVRREQDAVSLREAGSPALTTILVDVADAAQVEAAAKQIAGVVGDAGLGALVNNAGIAVAGPLEFVPVDSIRTQLDVNVLGLVSVTQAFLPLIRKANGRIVNIGSIGGSISFPFGGPYAASKFAVEAISDALRMELAPWKIGVVLIKPAAVATPLWERGKQAAMALFERMPDVARTLYARQIEAVQKVSDHEAKIGVAPEAVASLVQKALTVAKPKARYLIGPEVRLRWFASRFISDRMRDKMILKQMDLPR